MFRIYPEILRTLARNIDTNDIELQSESRKEHNLKCFFETVSICNKHSEERMYIFVKYLHDSLTSDQKIRVSKSFRKEITFYEKILPEFNKICRMNSSKYGSLKVAPYHGGMKGVHPEWLVLEDMKKSGFVTSNISELMTKEQLHLVLGEIAKLHALSFAWKEKKPENFENMRRTFNDEVRFSLKDQQLRMNKLCGEVIQYLGNNEYIHLMEQLTDQVLTLSVESRNADSVVLVHGDCWSGNFLFKYEDETVHNEPKEVCLIDWEAARFAPPVTDIIYLLCSSASKDALQNYKSLLKIYYSSLCRTLLAVDCNPDKIYPYEQLEDDWKKYCRTGLVVAMYITKIMQGEVTTSTYTNNTKYKNRISDIISFMYDYNFI